MSNAHDDDIPPVMGANGRIGFRNNEEQRPGFIDHAERARLRMAELRAQYGDVDEGDTGDAYLDRFYCEAPPGWTYEWKVHTVFNKTFPHYSNQLQRNGWAPVPAHRVRQLLWPEYSDETVVIDGLMLMERPQELTIRRRNIERIKATDQVRNSEAKLSEAPPGTAPRDAHRKTRPTLVSAVGPIGIPD